LGSRPETIRIVESLTGVNLSQKELTDLQPPSVLQRLKKQMGVKRIELQMLGQLERALSEDKARQSEKLKQQLNVELEIAGLVERAYSINDEERLVLRSTRPVRDPIDALEAKIHGREIEDDEALGEED